VAASKFKSISRAGTLTTSGALAVSPVRHATVQGTLTTSGALTVEVTLTPPPPPPEGTPLGETPPPEFLATAEGGVVEGAVVGKTAPPEFRLRG
jgi:hypothetical protein